MEKVDIIPHREGLRKKKLSSKKHLRGSKPFTEFSEISDIILENSVRITYKSLK